LDIDIDEGDNNNKEISAPKLLRVKNLEPVSNKKIGETMEKKNYPKSFDLIYQGSIGTIVHHYLEHQDFNPSLLSVESRLREMGIPSKLLMTFSSSIMEMLSKTRKDKHFDWIFKYRDSTEVESEYRNSSQSVVIDRLFIDDGTLWIIDFKTASIDKGETLGEFINRQKLSHQSQIIKYKEVLNDFYDLPSKAAIYCPAESQLIFL
jgi:ATP-dependent exoDNAse (exonuclease V) beta subunit